MGVTYRVRVGSTTYPYYEYVEATSLDVYVAQVKAEIERRFREQEIYPWAKREVSDELEQ